MSLTYRTISVVLLWLRRFSRCFFYTGDWVGDAVLQMRCDCSGPLLCGLWWCVLHALFWKNPPVLRWRSFNWIVGWWGIPGCSHHHSLSRWVLPDLSLRLWLVACLLQWRLLRRVRILSLLGGSSCRNCPRWCRRCRNASIRIAGILRYRGLKHSFRIRFYLFERTPMKKTRCFIRGVATMQTKVMVFSLLVFSETSWLSS